MAIRTFLLALLSTNMSFVGWGASTEQTTVTNLDKVLEQGGIDSTTKAGILWNILSPINEAHVEMQDIERGDATDVTHTRINNKLHEAQNKFDKAQHTLEGVEYLELQEGIQSARSRWASVKSKQESQQMVKSTVKHFAGLAAIAAGTYWYKDTIASSSIVQDCVLPCVRSARSWIASMFA